MSPALPTPTPLDLTGMAYDLRSRYAQIVGDILEEIARFRDKREFPRWFSLLEDLHIEINQKLTEKEKEKYTEELEKCIDVLNEHDTSYKGVNSNGEEKYTVYNAIKDLEMWLRQKMEDHKMFGGKGDPEGF